AMTARQRANCLGKNIGAVIVVGNRIVSTGYNGVPEGMDNCRHGGCYTCLNKYQKRGLKIKKNKKDNRKNSKTGKSYDECICVHAEQNALMSAARFGISIEGGIIYTTYQPCFTCLKQSLQAKIKKIYFEKQLYKKDHDRRLIKAYGMLQSSLPDKMWQVLASGTIKRHVTPKL
ncbi:hypothetical protein BVX98_00690, partial [bacterium F11]